MSYLQFHLVFILPPIALLAWKLRGRFAGVHPRAALFLGLMALIALVYTTPWDNYLVWRGVWSYGGDRVLGTIGYVPLEEYLFFVLQPLLAGLWLYLVILARPGETSARAPSAPEAARSGAGLVRAVGGITYLVLALLGAYLLTFQRGTYLGLILAWAAPVLALQWAYAGAEIWKRRRLWLISVTAPTLYLWIADALAIRLGIWSIALDLSTGILVLGLPVEEAVFFLITNLLVVQGLLLFLYPPQSAESAAVGYRLATIGGRSRPSTADRR